MTDSNAQDRTNHPQIDNSVSAVNNHASSSSKSNESSLVSIGRRKIPTFIVKAAKKIDKTIRANHDNNDAIDLTKAPRQRKPRTAAAAAAAANNSNSAEMVINEITGNAARNNLIRAKQAKEQFIVPETQSDEEEIIFQQSLDDSQPSLRAKSNRKTQSRRKSPAKKPKIAKKNKKNAEEIEVTSNVDTADDVEIIEEAGAAELTRAESEILPDDLGNLAVDDVLAQLERREQRKLGKVVGNRFIRPEDNDATNLQLFALNNSAEISGKAEESAVNSARKGGRKVSMKLPSSENQQRSSRAEMVYEQSEEMDEKAAADVRRNHLGRSSSNFFDTEKLDQILFGNLDARIAAMKREKPAEGNAGKAQPQPQPALAAALPTAKRPERKHTRANLANPGALQRQKSANSAVIEQINRVLTPFREETRRKPSKNYGELRRQRELGAVDPEQRKIIAQQLGFDAEELRIEGNEQVECEDEQFGAAAECVQSKPVADSCGEERLFEFRSQSQRGNTVLPKENAAEEAAEGISLLASCSWRKRKALAGPTEGERLQESAAFDLQRVKQRVALALHKNKQIILGSTAARKKKKIKDGEEKKSREGHSSGEKFHPPVLSANHEQPDYDSKYSEDLDTQDAMEQLNTAEILKLQFEIERKQHNSLHAKLARTRSHRKSIKKISAASPQQQPIQTALNSSPLQPRRADLSVRKSDRRKPPPTVKLTKSHSQQQQLSQAAEPVKLKETSFAVRYRPRRRDSNVPHKDPASQFE
jgi:hypothetical protein